MTKPVDHRFNLLLRRWREDIIEDIFVASFRGSANEVSLRAMARWMALQQDVSYDYLVDRWENPDQWETHKPSKAGSRAYQGLKAVIEAVHSADNTQLESV